MSPSRSNLALLIAFLLVSSCQFANVKPRKSRANFETPTTVVDQLTEVFFFDLSGRAETWSWTFEGGEPATSTERDPVVVYATPGIYDVTLTVTKGNKSSTLTKTDYIVVLPSVNLEAYYPFDESFADDSGNGHDATSFGVEFTTDNLGLAQAAASFDGVSYLEVPHNENLNYGVDDFSISLWVQTADPAEQMLIQKGGLNGPDDPQYWMRLNDFSGDITFLTGNGAPPSLIVTTDQGAINDNSWRHLVGVRDGDVLRLYLDNVLISEVSDTPQNVDNLQSLKMGVQIFGFNRNYLVGNLDEVRIYSKALTDNDINVLNYVNTPL